MIRRWLLMCLSFCLIFFAASVAAQAEVASVASKDLPREAKETLAAIKLGGPFSFARDGIVFGNYERRLPQQNRGYYREYTVPTPGLSHRGPRRIVSGGKPAVEYYYSDDHYRSFKKIKE